MFRRNSAGLNASNLSTGTVPAARLPSNVGAILSFPLPSGTNLSIGFGWGQSCNGSNASLNYAKVPLPFNCTLKNMYVAGNSNTATDVTITLFVAGVAKHTVTVSNGTKTGNNTATTFDATAGDLLEMGSNAAWTHTGLNVTIEAAPR